MSSWNGPFLLLPCHRPPFPYRPLFPGVHVKPVGRPTRERAFPCRPVSCPHRREAYLQAESSKGEGTLGSNSNKRKALALLAAAATLAGGLTAGTAYAGGEGGNRPGTGGGGAAMQFWQYKDDASGSWGSATDINSVSRA